MRLWHGVRAAWRRLWRSNELDREMLAEMRFHIEMEAERLAGEQGLDPREAHRQAAIRFGGVEKFKEEERAARPLSWLDSVSLDARLGLRMLLKYRGLTLVGGFAMAIAIAIGATFFEFVTELLDPAIPLQGGAGVIAVEYTTPASGGTERRVLHEFSAARDGVRSIEHLSAYRTARHNLLSRDAPPEPIEVAEITASAFALLRTPPLLGRYLLPSDERAGAEPVVVVGEQQWRSRFLADPQILGRTITLGGREHAVIGVMPAGFEFPLNHQFWTAFRVEPVPAERPSGPALHVFGRLAAGVTTEQAEAELLTLAQRVASSRGTTEQALRPVVLTFTQAHLGVTDPALAWALRLAQMLVGALAFVVAVNLAILVYARTMTRMGEIAVRSALGASRGRILAQQFVEALALTGLGAVAGLMLTTVAIERLEQMIRGSGGVIPFWIDLALSPLTVVYALLLAIVAAVLVGVLPAVKVTGRGMGTALHALSGRAGSRLGPLWTALVVTQVGLAVAVLPVAVYMSWQVIKMELARPSFPAEEFVVSSVALGDAGVRLEPGLARVRQLELISRLEAEPGVSRVTFSSSVPGFGPGGSRLEFEAGSVTGHESAYVSTVRVGPATFDVYDAEVFAGRSFNAGDIGARAVIVNRTFVDRFLDGRSPLGLRFRYAEAPDAARAADAEWHQVVGVVADFPRFPLTPDQDGEPTVYHPAAPGDVDPAVLSVRFNGAIPDRAAERFRQIGAEVHSALQVRDVLPLSAFYEDVRAFWRNLGWGVALVTTSVLLLSAAGIYALMSFTVVQRTREIGIRAALGAAPHRLLFSIFGRVTRQVALGVLLGSLLSGAVFSASRVPFALASGLLGGVAALMMVVGLLAAIGPARRSLRIQATEALRAD